MHFARPQPYRTPSGPVVRSPRQLEFSIALLAQEIVVAERNLDMLKAQQRYLEMELAERRTVRDRPMATLRPIRREPIAKAQPGQGMRRGAARGAAQTRVDDPDLMAFLATQMAAKETANGQA